MKRALRGSGLRSAAAAALVAGWCFGTGCGGDAAHAADSSQQNNSAEHAATAYPQFAKDEDYKTFRAKLVQAGWQPETAADADHCMAGDERCKGRPEMQSCAGTGAANCVFLWRKGDTVMAVSTVGIPTTVSGIECRSHCP